MADIIRPYKRHKAVITTVDDNISNILSNILAGFNSIGTHIEIFQNTGIERFQQEMTSLDFTMARFLQTSEQISTQATNMEVLPPNALASITATNQRIQELGSHIVTMQNIDISILDDTAINQYNAELEVVRGNLNDLVNLQENMNTAITQGDFTALNEGFTQINDWAESLEKRILDNTQALQEAANIKWDNQQRIEIFQNTGIERFQSEMQSLTDITNNFLQTQERISTQAASLKFLPQNAIDDITNTNQRIQELGSHIATMQNMDISMLGDAELTRLNDEYELMRGNLNNLVNLQASMNTAINEGDLTALNDGFTQINTEAQSLEKRIRENTYALQEMANIEWISPSNEFETTKETMQQILYTQEQISTTASSIDILPPNALSDINGMGERITELNSQIESMQQSRIKVVGAKQANAEVEALRGQLQQALLAQNDMNTALQNMDVGGANRAYQQLNATINQTGRSIRDTASQKKDFNAKIKDAKSAFKGLKSVISSVSRAVRAGARWLQQSVAMTNENIRLEQQLANVMASRGATYEEFARLQEKANNIQANTGNVVSSQAMLGAAAELSVHIGDIDAIEIMMASMADFAAGAGDIFGASAQSMAGYARYFTEAMAGNYSKLANRAGVSLSQAQKDVITYGDDMQRALMIQDIVHQSWGGLAEAMAQTPQGMQTSMTNAFNDIRSAIGAQLLPVIMTLFETIQAHMPQIEAMFQALVPVIQFIVGLFGYLIDVAFAVADVIMNNWGFIEPLLWGIVAALGAMKVAKFLAATATALKTSATMTLTAAIWAKTVAIWAKTAALLKNPITLIITLIAGLIGAIVAWVRYMGGLRIAWLTVMNAILTAWDFLKNGFMIGIEWILNLWDTLSLGLSRAGAAIGNLFDGIAAAVMGGLQNMVNGAIRLLNGLISVISNLPFVHINPIGEVSFGDNFQYNAYQRMRQRAEELAIAENEAELNRLRREQNRYDRETGAAYRRAARQDEIAYLRAEIAEQVRNDSGENYTYTDFVQMNIFEGNEGFAGVSNISNMGFESIGRDVSDIATHTSEMANISGENLKYWRDIAERDNINRFTTAKVNVRIAGISNTIHSEMDLDDVVDYITEGVEESLETTAERTNDYV